MWRQTACLPIDGSEGVSNEQFWMSPCGVGVGSHVNKFEPGPYGKGSPWLTNGIMGSGHIDMTENIASLQTRHVGGEI